MRKIIYVHRLLNAHLNIRLLHERAKLWLEGKRQVKAAAFLYIKR
jgi:hypothetical protein